MGGRTNLELKVVDVDPAASIRACRKLEASDEGVLRQRDTYFHVRSGRLKLREHLETSTAELVFYERADAVGIRPSRYLRMPVTAVADARAMLRSALGVVGVVEKRRHFFLVDNVRIHLDDVAGLGTFLEIEAVLAAADGDPAPAERATLSRVMRALGIDERDSVPGGYLDLQLARARRSADDPPAMLPAPPAAAARAGQFSPTDPDSV